MLTFALILRGSARTSAWSWQCGCCVGQYQVFLVKQQQKPLLLKNVLGETKIIFIKAYPLIYIILTWEECRRQADKWTSEGKTQRVWVVSWSSHFFFHGNYIFYLKAWLTDTLFWFGYLVDIFSKIEENKRVIFKKINGSLSQEW